MLVGAVAALAGAGYAPAYLTGLLLVPAGCGLLAMAGSAARGMPVAATQLVAGIRHRRWRHLALGAVQAGVLATALLNIGTGLAGDGLLAAMVVAVAGYVALFVTMLALAAWPILLDPRRRDLGVRPALRLALAVVAAHPAGLLVVGVLEAVLLAVTVQTVLLGLVLPALGALLAAHYVLPAADRLTDPDPSVG